MTAAFKNALTPGIKAHFGTEYADWRGAFDAIYPAFDISDPGNARHAPALADVTIETLQNLWEAKWGREPVDVGTLLAGDESWRYVAYRLWFYKRLEESRQSVLRPGTANNDINPYKTNLLTPLWK